MLAARLITILSLSIALGSMERLAAHGSSRDRQPAILTLENAVTLDGREVARPVRSKGVRPVYPENAFRAGLKGLVILKCTLDADGRVSDVVVMNGFRSLASASIDAVHQAVYEPARLEGVPVPVTMIVTASFSFGGNPRRDHLLSSVNDPDPEIRASAITWLAVLPRPGERERDAIEAALDDPEPLVRLAAQNSQARIKRK